MGHDGFSLYNREFQILMALCGSARLLAMTLALRALAASAERMAAALALPPRSRRSRSAP